MKRGRAIRTAVLALALLGLLIPGALAGKGGSHGKPGGGGEPPVPGEELAFYAKPQVKPAVTWSHWDLYRTDSNGATPVELRGGDDGHSWFEFHDPNVQKIAYDPRGEVVVAADAGLIVMDPADGSVVALAAKHVGHTEAVRWSRQRDALDELRPWTEQRIMIAIPEIRGPVRPDLGTQNETSNLFLAGMDGQDQHWRVTDFEDTWDPSTGIWHRVEAKEPNWIPEQAHLTGVAWILYFHEERTWLYDGPNEAWLMQDEILEWRILTLDVSGWQNGMDEDDVDGVDVLAQDWPTHLLSEDGRYAYVNQGGNAYVVSVDFSLGLPHVPQPTSLDLLPVVPPGGYFPDVELRAMNHDGSLLAVILTKDGKKGPERQLFVVTSDTMELTRADDGVKFEAIGPSAAFRPPQSP